MSLVAHPCAGGCTSSAGKGGLRLRKERGGRTGLEGLTPPALAPPSAGHFCETLGGSPAGTGTAGFLPAEEGLTLGEEGLAEGVAEDEGEMTRAKAFWVASGVANLGIF